MTTRWFIVIVTFITSHCCLGQNVNFGKGTSGILVVITNFHRSPPNCGFQKNISIYEAEVIDSLSVLQGQKILLCVQCKADTYSAVRGNHFVIKFSDECSSTYGIYNFTDYTEEKLKQLKKFNVVSLLEYSTK